MGILKRAIDAIRGSVFGSMFSGGEVHRGNGGGRGDIVIQISAHVTKTFQDFLDANKAALAAGFTITNKSKGPITITPPQFNAKHTPFGYSYSFTDADGNEVATPFDNADYNGINGHLALGIDGIREKIERGEKITVEDWALYDAYVLRGEAEENEIPF